jgi:putative spermidine/putrescine transport system ATP-binding protein
MALGDRVAVMEKGRIAQIGTPQDIYYRPANAFVADFIGTMNRVAGVAADGVLRVPGGTLPWSGASGKAEAMFRPEDVRIVDGRGDLAGTIVSAFFLGDHTRLVVDCGSPHPLTVETTERRAFRQGDPIALAVDPAALLKLEG